MGSRSSRSQTAGIIVADTRPSIRSTKSPWIARHTAAENVSTTRKTHISQEPRPIGLRNHLVDQGPGRNRNRQTQKRREQCHQEHHPELACEPRQAQAESNQVELPLRLVRQRPVNRLGPRIDPLSQRRVDDPASARLVEHPVRGFAPPDAGRHGNQRDGHPTLIRQPRQAAARRRPAPPVRVQRDRPHVKAATLAPGLPAGPPTQPIRPVAHARGARTSIPSDCPTVRHAVTSASPPGSTGEIMLSVAAAASCDVTDSNRAVS